MPVADPVLVKQLQAGSEGAFKHLMAIYGERVLNTCYRFLPDEADAQDLTQEVFIEVFRSVKDFRAESKLSTWIYRIAITKALDELRRRKRKKRWSGLKRAIGLEGEAADVQSQQNTQLDIEAKEKLSIVMRYMDDLPESQRVAFTLSKMNDFSNPEIAAILDTSVEAVESLIYRAKKTLKAWLEAFYKKEERHCRNIS